MCTRRLLARCPSAVKVGIGQLFGYELRWNKPSKDGSGKCNLIRTADTNTCLYGVVFSIQNHEKSDLDAAEGLGKGYVETELELLLNGSPTQAKAYVADKTDNSARPYSWYWDFVMSGAREHSLPESYISQIQAQNFVKDTNATRHQENIEILIGSKP
jgi:gamma-glutamylcyclotransferase